MFTDVHDRLIAIAGVGREGHVSETAAKSEVLSLMRTWRSTSRTATNVADMGDQVDYVERESVADVVAFLASPLARNVSGQVLVLA